MAASLRFNKLVQLFLSFTLGILCACLVKRIITKHQKVSTYFSNFLVLALKLFVSHFIQYKNAFKIRLSML